MRCIYSFPIGLARSALNRQQVVTSSFVVQINNMSKRQDQTPTSPGTAKRSKSGASEGVASPKSVGKTAIVVPDLEDCSFVDTDLPELRSSLLSWYDHNHRVLPWRRNPHSRLPEDKVKEAAAAGELPAPESLPSNEFIYRVWVSEIMSQQTQVSRAAEYFRKWVAKWPSVTALAAATQEEVNEVWAGLGYYRRARFLLEGAKYVASELGGDFPTTAAELCKIPGVGAYTSCAIASIACGKQSAVVDGNVVRVVSRLRQVSCPPVGAAATKLFADLAGQVLDPERPGDFNQAVMELGATVCVPNTRPSCNKCPVSKWCSALAAEKRGDKGVSVTDYPGKVEKADKREESVAVAVVRVVAPGESVKDKTKGKFVLVKRPPGGLLAGLWEFPLQHVAAGASREELRSAMDELLTGLGVSTTTEGSSKKSSSQGDAEKSTEGGAGGASTDKSSQGALKVLERKSLGEVVHVFSHIRMTMHVEKIVLQGEVPAVQEGGEGDDGAVAETQWLSEEDLGAKGLSSGVKKVFKLYSNDKATAAASIKNFFKPKS